MAIRLTESKLRQIIREEASRLVRSRKLSESADAIEEKMQELSNVVAELMDLGVQRDEIDHQVDGVFQVYDPDAAGARAAEEPIAPLKDMPALMARRRASGY
jgi:hypothetical protein